MPKETLTYPTYFHRKTYHLPFLRTTYYCPAAAISLFTLTYLRRSASPSTTMHREPEGDLRMCHVAQVTT